VEGWIAFARGPMFRAALLFMVLGLVRHAVMTIWEMRRMFRRAGDKTIPYRKVFITTVKWLFPVGKIHQRLPYSLTTLVFHVSVIVVPIFLAGHIALWAAGTGVSWPAISNGLADILTIAAVATALLLVVERAAAADSRVLSRFQDYAIPLLIALPFASGFLVRHPTWNPFPLDAALFVHVVSANLLLILIPLTKLSHMILLPATPMVTELAWHFPPDAGRQVGVMLDKVEQPI
jgi:nitrate reductase gamma subunit